MSLTKKAPAHGGADPKDEIEQIMSEIELLQKEIGQTESHVELAPAKPTLGPTVRSSVVDSDPLEEFRASALSGEPSLEDTLADLKDEGGSGRGILDDELDSEPEVSGFTDANADRARALARAEQELEEAFEDEGRSIEEIHETETFAEEEHMSGHDNDHGKQGDGALNMTLRGNMTLKLQYEVEGQAVVIGFSEGTMRVQLADGTEFKIPIRSRAGARRAA